MNGEISIRANISGGAGGAGIFAGPPGGIQKVVATGDPKPGGGTFSSIMTSGISLSDAGDTYFLADGGIWVNSAAGVISKIVAPGDAAPAAVGGTFDTATSFYTNAAGDIIISTGSVPPNGPTKTGMWRVKPDNSTELIMVRGQPSSQFGGGTIASHIAQGGAVNDAGCYPFTLRVAGGNFGSAIVLYVPIR